MKLNYIYNYESQSPHQTMQQFIVLNDQKGESTQLFESINSEALFKTIRENEIKNESLIGPFGKRKIVYCDYTASGRPLEFIEDYIRDNVLPNYANTHTLVNETARQTSHYREEAREIIKKSVNANQSDALIFTGSGSTGAIHKLARCLNFNSPIVFISPYEHHSNILIWREITEDVISIDQDDRGNIDLECLEKQLKHYTSDPKYAKKRLIGSFSAASNITGILTDVDQVAILMHTYGGLAFFDYAAAAPYVKIDMNPAKTQHRQSNLAYKDAIFISTHKFIGGPQTPGILIAKAYLFKNKIPDGCGGGTVFYVTEKDHEYLSNIEEREEGGTPAIVESIRAGLVFKLKDDCNIDMIMQKEHYYAEKVIRYLKQIKNLKLLGSVKPERLPIFSFLILNEESGYFLHHNFVSALLNDLFGIQTRSGCACAGPYAQRLLGISEELADSYVKIMKHGDSDKGHGIFKPGFTRFSVTYFMDEGTVDYVLECIKFVSLYGWMFLPFYDSDVESGVWNFKSILYKQKEFNKLSDISYFKQQRTKSKTNASISNDYSLQQASIMEAYETIQQLLKLIFFIKNEIARLEISNSENKLLWFLLPAEAYRILRNKFKMTEYTTVSTKSTHTRRPNSQNYIYFSYY